MIIVMGSQDQASDATFAEIVDNINCQRPYTKIRLSDEALETLNHIFGKNCVLDAMDDKTSVLSRLFVEHYKTDISIEYKPFRSAKSNKTVIKLLNELQKQFEKIILRPCTEKDLMAMEEAIVQSKSRINLVESRPKNVDIEECISYFERIKEIAFLNISQPDTDDSNDYEKALEIVRPWPFLASYVKGNSLITNSAVLKEEYAIRCDILKKIEDVKHDKKNLFKEIVRSFPHPISSHFHLSKAFEKMRLHHGINRLQLAGLSLNEEILRMHLLFVQTRAALQKTPCIDPLKSNFSINTSLYVAGKGFQKIMLKTFENLKQYQYEIAAREMSEIGGFACVTLPIKRSQLMLTSFTSSLKDKEQKTGGDISQTVLGIHKTKHSIERITQENEELMGGKKWVTSQIHIDCQSGKELTEVIINKLQLKRELFQRSGISIRNDRTNDYQEEIKPFFSIDPFYFEMATLNSFILGTKDAHYGNYLFTEDHKLYCIDHKKIMPENNEDVSVMLPVLTHYKIESSQVVGTQFRDYLVSNVCPLTSCLIGLPQANQPFSIGTIHYVLAHLNRTNFIRYHSRKKLFSQEQVDAQLMRIDLVRNLFKAEKLKPTISLTPRALYLEIVGKHETYQIMKDVYKLTDYHIFQYLGKTSKNVTSSEVTTLLYKLNVERIFRVQRSLKKLSKGKTIQICSDESLENPLLGVVEVRTVLSQLANFIQLFSQDDGLTHLFTGVKRAPVEQRRLSAPMQKPIPSFFEWRKS